MQWITHTEEEKVDRVEVEDEQYLYMVNQQEKVRSLEHQKNIQTNLLYLEEKLERIDNYKNSERSFCVLLTNVKNYDSFFADCKFRKRRIMNHISPSQTGTTLVVVASFFPFTQTEIDTPLTLWVTQGEFYRGMIGKESVLPSLLASDGISNAVFWIRAVPEKFLEYKDYLGSQGIDSVQRVSVEEIRSRLKSLINSFTDTERRSVISNSGIVFMALGVNPSAIEPEYLNNPAYKFVSFRDVAPLEVLPNSVRLVVMVDQGSTPETILKMKQLSQKVGAKFVQLYGSTGTFNAWLRRTDLSKEIPTLPEPKAQLTGGKITVPDQLETAGLVNNNNQEMGATVSRTKNGKGAGIKDLIKQFWAETGGSPKLLLEKIRSTGRDTTISSVNSAKWALVSEDGWKPPTVGSNDPPVASVAQPAGVKSRKTAKTVEASPAELIRQGVAMVEEGLKLIGQGKEAFGTVEQRLAVLDSALSALKKL